MSAHGDSVEFSLTVSNAADDPVDLQFRDAKLADFAVFSGDTEVWRWSEGRMFAQVLKTETLGPGDSETFAGEWPDPQPGEYEVVATLESDPGLSVRESFSV